MPTYCWIADAYDSILVSPHTFADEDTMSQLKKWARRSNGKKRERVVSRLSRMRLRTLVWKLPELANRAR